MSIKKLLLMVVVLSIILLGEENKTSTPPTENKTLKSKDDNNISHLSEKIKVQLKGKLDAKNKKFLRQFYKENSYNPLWLTLKGLDEKRYLTLFSEIEKDITLSCDSKIYKEYLYLSKYIREKKGDDKIYIELKLTDLYVDFLKYTLYGNINWKSFNWKLSNLRKKRIAARWVRYKPPYNISELLLEKDISKTIDLITPKRFGYMELLKALIKLRSMEDNGGWKELPKFKKLQLGDSGLNVVKLRERLKASNDLVTCKSRPKKLFESDDPSPSSSDGSIESEVKIQPQAQFDTCLEDAVKKFQKRHGLVVDGIVGRGTRRVLNIPVESKIETVLLNLNRIKWLPRDDDERYLVANIPEYMLHYIEKNIVKKSIRIVVGDKKHHTPIFTEKVSYIVLNPYWKVPKGIVKREIIPAMIRNPNYLRKEGLEIRKTWYERSPRIDPNSIYWAQYGYGYEFGRVEFPYKIMQPPGPKNALGKIKFKFPNKFDVYLHDTPSKHLFKRTNRAFSHGCVRLSEPYELLKIFASFNKEIDMKKADHILKGKRKVQITIKNKIPIYLIYITAGYDMKNDELLFRNDVYGYDKMQELRVR